MHTSDRLALTSASGSPRPTCGNGRPWPSCFPSLLRSPTLRRLARSSFTSTSSEPGDGDGLRDVSHSRRSQDENASPAFPPPDRSLVQATACELVHRIKRPLSCQLFEQLTTRSQRAQGKPISRSIMWRILHEAAIKTWQYKYWLFPHDPRSAEKVGQILDHCSVVWEGLFLAPKDHIISADEMTRIQARIHCHPNLVSAPGRPLRIERKHQRGGTLQVLASWDFRQSYLMGRCERATDIKPFGRLVAQEIGSQRHQAAERVLKVVKMAQSIGAGQPSIAWPSRVPSKFRCTRRCMPVCSTRWRSIFRSFRKRSSRQKSTPSWTGWSSGRGCTIKCLTVNPVHSTERSIAPNCSIS